MTTCEVLEKINIGINEETTAVAELIMSNGMVYNFHVKRKQAKAILRLLVGRYGRRGECFEVAMGRSSGSIFTHLIIR
jgi:hypothetical protein